MRISSASLRRRISRSLVTSLVLSASLISSPIYAPELTATPANAADLNLIQTNLTFDANATAGANDVAINMTFGSVAPTHTNSGVGYYTFDGTLNKFAYVNRDFANAAPVSIFMWVYPTASGMILNHSGQTTPYDGFRLSTFDYTASGKFRLGLYSSGGAVFLTSTQNTPINNWYYIGVTYDGSTMRGYINGQLIGTSTAFSWLTAASDYFHVGSSQNGTCFGTCPTEAGSFLFGQFSIYRSTLSGANVLTNYNATQNRFAPIISNPTSVTTDVNQNITLASGTCTTSSGGSCTYQWQRSTDSGANWSDIAGATSSTLAFNQISRSISGNQYRVIATDGGNSSPNTTALVRTSLAATLTVNTPLSGETDTAFSISGTQYGWAADTGTGGVFDIRGAITLEAWVYPTESTAGIQYSVVTKSEAYQLFHVDGIWKYALMGSTSWGSGISTLIPVELNEWHHIAFTRAAATNEVNFYYDGVLAFKGSANTASTSTIADSSFPFAIGGMVYNGPTLQYGFKGRIDNVAIFDSVRGASSIATDMHSYISPTTSGLRFYYDMNEGLGTVLYNRASTAVPASDLAIVGSPAFPDIKEASVSGSYNVLKFPRSYITSDGGWRVPSGIASAATLVVGGGGGGGSRVGGGGGAGALLYQPSITLTPGAVEAITIGQGGIGGKTGNIVENNYQGVNGQDTVFGSRYTLLGGGGGGGYNTAANTGHEGKSGGSGGGAAPNFSAGSWPAGTGGGASTQSTTYGYGSGFSGGSGFNGTGYPGGGGGGSAGAAANLTSTSVAGNGGAATLDPILGTTTCYAGGGGGGVGELFSGAGGAGGSCAGGATTAGSGGKDNTTVGGSALANSGSGGGGSGYQSGSNNSTDKAGGHGGSGIIIIKFVLTTTKPIFEGPRNDTTTAGLTETFTVLGDANAPMVRSYLWQVSTDTGTSWSTPTQGSGWFTSSYVTPVLTTTVSGPRYLYRVIVTDTDTAGMRIVDTSSAVFLIINPVLTMTGNTTIQKAINVTKFETFTVTGGTATHRYSLSPTISGITLDTSTALSPRIRISETRTVGTYLQTLTVTDSVSATVSLQITIQVIAPPSFSATSDMADSGTVLHLDAANSASYPKSGNSWNDLSGRNLAANFTYNSGTSSVNVNGATRTNTTWMSSVQCVAPSFTNDAIGALTFNGSSTCSYIPSFGYLSTHTYEVWLKRDGDQTSSAAVITTPYRFTGDQINISLHWTGSAALVAGIFNGSAWASTAAATIPNQTWVHAAVTFNGSTLSLIINGDTTTSTSVSVTWNPAILDNGLFLGRKWDNNPTYKGSIGSIRIYDRVLSLSEIQQNYNSTKARFLGTSNKIALTKKYGTRVVDTYTMTSGAGALSVTLASNAQSAIKWDTSTARSTTLTAQESLTVGSYLETITVTDALGQSSYLPLRYTVTQADTLTITMDTATSVTFNGSQITMFPKPVFRGLVGVDTLTVTTKFSSPTYSLSATRPTNADTYTVIASDPVFAVGAASNYLAITYETSTAVVNKARQAPLNPSLYGASIGSPFYLSLLGGSGDGAVTETLTGTSTAPNCAINSKNLTSTTNVIAYCTVTFTKAASQNYLLETITVQVYFMSYAISQPSGQTGGGPTIGINGETSITRDPNQAPNITGVSSSGDMTFPIAITGSGFTASSAGSTTIKFWRNQVLGGSDFTIKSDTLIWAKQPVGATEGKVLVINNNGTAVSPANFTPLVFNI